ncbi:alpha/beta fold hydrolase [Vitiosangium sp. GDMCC 1.1324]|uniref:alpha/beta fold hydrolase n=1 Tax=Vitiosangium sp. (strain GDMCC 1.1324) TaxID=2138576 RepID=UPI000D39E8FA|nr:alpha/beta fold hydrolase [Vitiosangium sp. GDMCC 1.1324]PTL83790.1 aspartate kinase [Vitiosangium sp. GDMCC 1.1324]
MTPPPGVFDLSLPDLPLEAGARVTSHVARGWWWGPEQDLPWLRSRAHVLPEETVRENALRVVRRTKEELRRFAETPRREAPVRPDASVPTVLLVHALTGDMRAGGPGGWWEPVIGPGRAFDPEKVRLLCFNNLGSCYGSSGPADEGFPSRVDDRRFGPPAPLPKGDLRLNEYQLPATITPWDQARAILQALDALGIDKVSLVTGGSLGGMIVLCLAVLAPKRFERIAPIAAAEEASSWVVGWNHVARQALLLDPEFPEAPARGLELARQLAMLTYRAEPGLDSRHGRNPRWSSRALYPIQSYLEYQGEKLRARFDARSYLALLGAMDHHDLSRIPGEDTGVAWGISRIRASTLAVGIDHDQLFYPEHMEKLVERLRAGGRHAEYAELSCIHGHDGFLIEWTPLDALLRRALALPPGGVGEPHARAVETRTEVSLLLLGRGTVGGNLLEQLRSQQAVLSREHGAELRVAGIVDTRHLLFDARGVPLNQWRERLEPTHRPSPAPGDVLDVLERLRRLPTPVLVDCTAADGMGFLYAEAFRRGIHVVSANKKPLTLSWAAREQLFRTAREHQRVWHYETTVGASLPVIRTLADLVRTGDRVRLIEGCLSGTLGFLSDQLTQGVPLSRAVRLARERGYTEPHPRDDLLGVDVARKALILARELGLEVSQEDVEVEPFVPKQLLGESDVERFLESLEDWDKTFASRIDGLRAERRVLRYLARVEPPAKEGQRPVLKVGPIAVHQEHPAARLRGSEAFVAFTTERHAEWPLLVQGAGAGGAVTAAGVLADVLEVARASTSRAPAARR